MTSQSCARPSAGRSSMPPMPARSTASRGPGGRARVHVDGFGKCLVHWPGKDLVDGETMELTCELKTREL